ncbi:MAG: DUF1214 domain-containing protein [Mycobacterium sp.]
MGRVGALALMLGIGSVLAWTPAALADTTGSAESAASSVASTGVKSATARPRTAATRVRGGGAVGMSSAAPKYDTTNAALSTGSGGTSARNIRTGKVTVVPSPASSITAAVAAASPASDGNGAGSAAEPLLGAATELTNRASHRTSQTATPAASTTGAPPLAFATASALGGFTLPVGPIRAAIIAAQAYIYGYPILAVQRVQSLLGPLNTMNINTSFASADAAPFWKAIGGGSRPNVNVLYSLASLDLSNGPVVLSIPNMGDRYYSFQLNDPYIDVDNYISSNPTAGNPIGGPGPGRYAITWIGNDVDVPGAQKVLVNYSSELMLGRVEATTADQQEVVDLMEQWTLTPTGETSINNAVLPSAYLSPISVLNAISLAMTQNPAYPTDTYASELAKLAQIGVGPDPNDPTTALQVQDTLGPISQLAAAISTQITAILLPPLTDLTQKLSAFQHQGWAVTKSNIGDYGTDYLYRAGVALVGLVANTPDQALYFPGLLDSNYLPLKGIRTYLIHYAPGQAPPIDDGGFWSLTVYNSDGTLVDSSTLNVYSNGPVVINPDGSIDVILSQVDPGDPNSNWLQTPAGDFSVYLRIYAPGQAAADGTWLPQPIQRTSGLFG